MTGYGESQGDIDGVTYIVEIKAVNSRYLKINIKLPDAAAFLEEDIDKLLRKNLSRGTINYTLKFKDVSADVLFDIDEAALQAYIEKLSSISASTGIDCKIDIGGLLSLPGIVRPVLPEGETAEQVRDVVKRLTQEAIDELKKMRASEGAALAADLDECCDVIKEDIQIIRARSPVVLEEYRKKLNKRVDSLLADAKLKLDQDILAREVAIFADRSDISEELVRLESHLHQFAESRQDNALTGRRLDFISQEMLREANTVASKALDTEIIRYVVDMKCQIDRIKEQVQNIE